MIDDIIVVRKGDKKQYGNFHYVELKMSSLPSENIEEIEVDGKILRILNFMRSKLGKPVKITSLGRTPAYNETLPGSSKNSYHLIRKDRPVYAVDSRPVLKSQLNEYKQIVLDNISTLKAMGLKGVGFYNSFIHLDTGGEHFRCWNVSSDLKKKLQEAKPTNEFLQDVKGIVFDFFYL